MHSPNASHNNGLNQAPPAAQRAAAREAAALLGRIDAAAERLDMLQGLLQSHEGVLCAHVESLALALRQAGLETPDEIERAYEALDPAQRDAIERELAAPSPGLSQPAKPVRRRMDRMV